MVHGYNHTFRTWGEDNTRLVMFNTDIGGQTDMFIHDNDILTFQIKHVELMASGNLQMKTVCNKYVRQYA